MYYGYDKCVWKIYVCHQVIDWNNCMEIEKANIVLESMINIEYVSNTIIADLITLKLLIIIKEK